MNQQSSERITFAFNQSLEDTPILWKALLEVLRPRVTSIFIDAHPSPEWGDGFFSLPKLAQNAHYELAQFEASKGRKKGNLLAVSLDAEAVVSQWEAISEYGSHSIYVEVNGEDGAEPILTNDDSGSIMARLTAEELAKAAESVSAFGINLSSIIEPWLPKPSFWQRLFKERKHA